MNATMEEIGLILIQVGPSSAEQQGKEGASVPPSTNMDPYWWWINGEELNTIGACAPEGPNSFEQLPIPAQ